MRCRRNSELKSNPPVTRVNNIFFKLRAWAVFFALVCCIEQLTHPSLALENTDAGRAPVTVTALRALIKNSISSAAGLHAIRNRIGFFFVRHPQHQRPEEDFLFTRMPIEFGIFGRTLGLALTNDEKFGPSSDSSELVVFNSYDDNELNELDQKLPGAKKTIIDQQTKLGPTDCQFFSIPSTKYPDDIQTAFIFVGAKLPITDMMECVHTSFLKAFGVWPQTENGIKSYRTEFLIELTAVSYINLCSNFFGAEREQCVDKKISEMSN